MRNIQGVLIFVAGLLLAACGGGDQVPYCPPGGACNNNPGGSTATSLTLQLSTASVSNSGADDVVATATAAMNGGQTVSGVPVTFTVDNGATFTPGSDTTDGEGVVTANVNVGSDRSNRIITVTATSGSLTATASFAVTGATLTSTATPAVVAPSSEKNKVFFVLKDAVGAPMAQQPIQVVAGSAGTDSGLTDSNGAYTFVYTAPSEPGALQVIATAGGVERIQDVQVQTVNTVPPARVACSPSGGSCTVASNPSVVAPNVDDSTNNRAEVRALFIDANNRAIANMRVRFFASGFGSFATGDNIVYSDANGQAITGFIPGARPSPANGVTITACYSRVDFASCGEPGVTSITTTLTVAADPLSITIGTDGKIVVGDLTYIQRFVVMAVDIAGRAKANVEVVPSIDLPYFFKGMYTYSGGQWVSTCNDVTACPIILTGPVGCPNEDVNRTGFYQEALDTNLNGQFDPRKSDVVVSAVGGTKTDSTGKMTIQIEYPKNVGSWLQYRLLVSAGVNGTEGRATWSDVLGVPISDVKAEGAPAFVRSVYGVATATQVPSINPGRGPVAPCANAD